MRKTTISKLLIVSVAVFALKGCGRGDSPGVKLDVTIMPTYNNSNTSSVDAVQDTCPSGSPEYFADHTATATITASLLNNDNLAQPITIYIDSYTISYSSLADSSSAPLIQDDKRDETLTFTVSAKSTTEFTSTVTFVDLIRKTKYLQDLLSGKYGSSPGYLNNYSAAYTFEGHSDRGTHFTISAQSNFQIGDFDNCP